MPDKPIQEQFGEKIIATVREFARDDIQDVATLEFTYFNHLNDRHSAKR